MSYHHVLVAVAITPESHILVEKAVSIVRPVNGEITLLTLTTDPELYNQMSAPMLDNMRGLMQEETRQFFEELKTTAGYPVQNTRIACGSLCENIVDQCQRNNIDLVICGNHNKTFFSKLLSSPHSILADCHVDMLLVPLG